MASDFSTKTCLTLAFRAAVICSNPECSAITAGPSEAYSDLKLKVGEGAHICASRPRQARFNKNMSDTERASPDNGIWLCAHCHALIDKNRGADFPTPTIREWKRLHEDRIRSLVMSHRSPLPDLRKKTDEGQIAQDVVDALESHGALFIDHHMEVPLHVNISIKELRTQLNQLAREIRWDSQLKQIIKDLADNCRSYMNETSRFPEGNANELETLRRRVGIKSGRLRNEYGCHIRGPLNRIIP